MQKQPKKQAKQDKIKAIRSFNAGEDVSLLFEPAIVPVFAETKHLVDEDRHTINGKPCTMQEYEQAIAQSNFVWQETLDYRSSNDTLISEDEAPFEADPSYYEIIEPVSKDVKDEPVKPVINEKLLESKNIFDIMKARKQKFDQWLRINSEFLGGFQ